MREIESFLKTNYQYLIQDGYKFEGVFTYKSEDGAALYYKARYKNHALGKKHFAYVHEQNKKLIKTKPKFLEGDPLYNLPAIKATNAVWFVEGELKADALSKLGVVVTTSGGLNTVNNVDYRPLATKKVIIWPDAGDTAPAYVAALSTKLFAFGCSVSQVDLAALSLEPKEDCADWLKKNPDVDLEAIPLLDLKLPRPNLSKISSEELLSTVYPPRERFLPWLLKQSVNMIHAWRGTGKTHVAFGIAYALSTGNSFLKWTVSRPASVLYIDGELAVTELQERLNEIVASHYGEIPTRLHWVTPDLQLEGMPDLATVQGQTKIDNLIGDTEVIIIDNLSCLVRGDGNENDAESWSAVQEWALKKKREGKTIIFIHHSGKGGAQRGTSKREDIMDCVLALRTPKDYQPTDGAYFEVHFEKKRHLHGKDSEPFSAKMIKEPFGPVTWEVKSMERTTREQVWKLYEDGLKQTEIAKELGIAKSLVSKYAKEKDNKQETEENETEF